MAYNSKVLLDTGFLEFNLLQRHIFILRLESWYNFISTDGADKLNKPRMDIGEENIATEL